MKLTYLLVIALFFVLLFTFKKQRKEPAALSLYECVKVQPKNFFVEFKILIEHKKSSLSEALNDTEQTIQLLEKQLSRHFVVNLQVNKTEVHFARGTHESKIRKEVLLTFHENLMDGILSFLQNKLDLTVDSVRTFKKSVEREKIQKIKEGFEKAKNTAQVVCPEMVDNLEEVTFISATSDGDTNFLIQNTDNLICFTYDFECIPSRLDDENL